jgi:ElaB/YqjD/DUF883 family membrane-anchored ribosome-binding protein
MQQPPRQEPPSEAAGGAVTELRSDAQQLGSSAANRVHSELDARKGDAAQQVKSVSSAMQKAARELDQSSPEWLRSALQKGADQIQQLADAVEHKSSRELMSEAQNLARSNPGTFLTACAAAGFAAARILKAGGEQQSGTARQNSGQQRSAEGNQLADRSGDGNRARSDSSGSNTNNRANTPGEFA